MTPGKLADWLQIGANVGILAGLILVALQISQNSQLMRVEMSAKTYELAMQENLALLGEDPSSTLAKAAMAPTSLSDQELLVVSRWAWYWWNLDSRNQVLLDNGLIEEEGFEEFVKNRAIVNYGANRLTAEVWKVMTENGFRFEWERIVDAEMKRSVPDHNARLIKRLRKATEVGKKVIAPGKQ